MYHNTSFHNNTYIIHTYIHTIMHTYNNTYIIHPFIIHPYIIIYPFRKKGWTHTLLLCHIAGQNLSHNLIDPIAVVQLLSRVWLFATPWVAARQASPSITSFQSLPKLKSIESVMPSNHLSLCRPLLLLPPIPPVIRVFSDESALRIRWPKYWSFSLSISPSNEFLKDWFPLGQTGLISLQSKRLSRVFFKITVQKHQFSKA